MLISKVREKKQIQWRNQLLNNPVVSKMFVLILSCGLVGGKINII